jgi:uncharacterized protein YukJ
MPLANYGLLTGNLSDHGPQPGGNPHYDLIIDADDTTYRVPVNLKSGAVNGQFLPELQYQHFADLRASDREAMRAFVAGIQNGNTFRLADDGGQRLDYIHAGLLDTSKFITLPHDGGDPQHSALASLLIAAARKAKGDNNTFVAAFGTGFPPHVSTFQGVDNIHMNQGSFRQVGHGGDRFFRENGPKQDGAVLFFHSDGTVEGFFTKFQSQDTLTDEHGLPVHTGIGELDALPEAERNRAAPPAHDVRPLARRATAARAAAGGFVFADPTGGDPSDTFKPDDDGDLRFSPFVEQFAKYGVPEPVPGPRGGVVPRLNLATVIGDAEAQAVRDAGQIVFHSVGDTGAPEKLKLPHELAVADLMLRDFEGEAADRPSFFFHLGDVVYYYGEADFYYDQFYKPFRAYPAPVFAIPGNHDGITYKEDMESLAGFKQAFVDTTPRPNPAAGGIARTTMIQPGVFFTLDAPLVSIVGLYSNCAEEQGYLDQQQKLFLYSEMKRLKPLRENGQVAAVLLAVHHPPISLSKNKPSSVRMNADIDAACDAAGCWPDAVLSGHAHLYQNIVRTRMSRETPYIVSGSGGYDATQRTAMQREDFVLGHVNPEVSLKSFMANYGFLRVVVKPGSLRIEFKSPQINEGKPADACLVDLNRHKVTL